MLSAELVTAESAVHRFKVRNISATGLMGEMETVLTAGDRVMVKLGDAIRVLASVAWSVPPRFGMRFDHPVDPVAARRPVRYEPRPFPRALAIDNRRRV